MAAVACKLESEALVALILTAVSLLTLGATKTPVEEIVPALADQTAAVFAVPLKRAVNCCCPRELTVAALGETAIEAEEPPKTTICTGVEPYIADG